MRSRTNGRCTVALVGSSGLWNLWAPCARSILPPVLPPQQERHENSQVVEGTRCAPGHLFLLVFFFFVLAELEHRLCGMMKPTNGNFAHQVLQFLAQLGLVTLVASVGGGSAHWIGRLERRDLVKDLHLVRLRTAHGTAGGTVAQA